MEFQTYSREKGYVVSPGAWMFHKGITFAKRKSSSKMLKDLYGIWYVATQLGNFSERALTEFHVLAKKHSKWFMTLQKKLHNWIENVSPDEWSRLETQDPSGKLKKLSFKRIMTKFTADN